MSFFLYGMAPPKRAKNRVANGMPFFIKARSRSENGTAPFFEVSQTFRREGKMGRHHQNRRKLAHFWDEVFDYRVCVFEKWDSIDQEVDF